MSSSNSLPVRFLESPRVNAKAITLDKNTFNRVTNRSFRKQKLLRQFALKAGGWTRHSLVEVISRCQWFRNGLWNVDEGRKGQCVLNATKMCPIRDAMEQGKRAVVSAAVVLEAGVTVRERPGIFRIKLCCNLTRPRLSCFSICLPVHAPPKPIWL